MSVYREHDEFASLEQRVTALEKIRKQKPPVALKLWHTFAAGLIGVGGAIYGVGYIYDHMSDCGLRVSTYIIVVITGLLFAILAIASLASTDMSGRKGLRDPWRMSK